MTSNLESSPQTQKEIKRPDKKTMAERVKEKMESENKQKISDFKDFFRTDRGDDFVSWEELEAMGYVDDTDLAKEAYREMAEQAVGDDQLAKEILKVRLDEMMYRDAPEVWHHMQRFSPDDLAKVARQTAGFRRESMAKDLAKEQKQQVYELRKKMREPKRAGQTKMTPEQAETFKTQLEIRRAAEQGGGYGGVGQGEAPQEFVQAASREKSMRKGKGFETAAGEFENKGEAFTAGMTLEKLAAKQFIESLAQGMNKKELSEFRPHAKRYLEQFEEKKRQWDEEIAGAAQAGKTDKAERLRALAKRSAELDNERLQALADSIKKNRPTREMD